MKSIGVGFFLFFSGIFVFNIQAQRFTILAQDKLKARDTQGAMLFIDSCIRFDERPTDCLWELANIRYDFKQYDQAVRVLSSLIHQLPQDYTAWNLKGLSYIELKQYDSAKICFQQAVKLNPDEAHFYSNWAKAYVGLGDFDKATRLYSTAILLDDAQPNFYINRSICYDQLGIEDKAREDFKKAQSLNPNNPLLKQNKTIVQKYATKSWIKFIMFSGILLGIMILITILRKKQWNHENN